MKKMLVILLAALTTMSFAVSLEESSATSASSCTSYAPRVKLNNRNGSELKGFKLAAYVYNHDSKAEPQILWSWGKRARYDRVSKQVFKITVDFSDFTLKAGEVYDVGMFLDVGSASSYKGKGCWSAYPTNLNKNIAVRDVVVEDLKGNVLYGKRPTFNSRVGVLTSSAKCNNGMYMDYISLDVENSNNKSGVRNGNSEPKGISFAGGHVTFYYCAVDAANITRVPYDYVVLRMDDECPAGTYPFRRRHDTQDKGTNVAGGQLRPSDIGDNATLEYCFVPKNTSSTKKYPFESAYGIFANQSGTNLSHSEIYIDDEDSDNNNSWYMYGASESIQNRIHNIVSGSKNTTMHVLQWNGGSLAKAAAIEAPVAEISTPVVAKATLADIKSVTRENIGIELQTAGNVDVTIAGIDGHVYAKVSANNLQAGVHNLNWNAANIPAGHYIVSVKHNGNISGKNVILK